MARPIRAKETPMKIAMKRRGLGTLLALVGVLAIAGQSAAILPDYRFQPIDNPDAGELGTSVYGINPAGVMVGNFAGADNVIRGFVLRRGQYTDVTVADSIS